MGGSRDKETRFGLKGLRFNFFFGSSSELVTVWPNKAKNKKSVQNRAKPPNLAKMPKSQKVELTKKWYFYFRFVGLKLAGRYA